MPAVTLYTFRSDGVHLITVYRDSDDPTFIDYFTNTVPGPVIPQPPDNQIVGRICKGTTQYTYFVRTEGPPYAYQTNIPNSPACGYIPPACDITEKTFKKTDETASGANDGTVNLFATSSFPPITYTLVNTDTSEHTVNSTGYFTGLHPGNYSVSAQDANGCGLYEIFQIQPFSDHFTHYKYRLKFLSADGSLTWELRFLDMLNNYDNTLYPVDVIGLDRPVQLKTADQNEDKTTGIVTSQLNIGLWFDHNSPFTIEEFALAPEQSWKIELYRSPGFFMTFQGWLIPDETSNEYNDPGYALMLTATDGLASLKGNLWGDGSGGQGYGSFQIQQYGLTQWCKLVKQCFDQLGYPYGTFRIVSSLRYNGLYSRDLWLNIGCWSDILYDGSGNAVTTYDALNLLMTGMKLRLIQHEGNFWAININDLYYIQNNLVSAEYLNCFYLFANDFSEIEQTGADVEQLLHYVVGNDQQLMPVNPPQNITYDKPYNIKESISFNALALLFDNPSFEIGAVQGLFPPFMASVSNGFDVNAFFNYDPTTDTQEGAYDGSWELRVMRHTLTQFGDSYIKFQQEFTVDQYNKQASVSIYWRPSFADTVANTVPGFIITFIDSHGALYVWNTDNNHPLGWIAPPSSFYNILQLVRIKDPSIWTQYQVTTSGFPGSGIGTLNFRIEAPLAYDGVNTLTTHHPNDIWVDLDMLEITLQDSSPAISLQTGETHAVTAVTGIPNANLKNVDQSLFTYTGNKRVAGNIFMGSQYISAVVANLWNFALHPNDKQDRLPATITKAIARNYARQMYKFEGSVIAPFVSFYSVFSLKYYEGRIFVPFSIEGDLRTNIWHLILIEIDDSDAQNTYQYTPVYQKSARNNS